MTTQAATTSTQNSVFNRETDRCDQAACGSEAKTRVIMLNGFELLFCGHHTQDHQAKLADQGGTFYFNKN